MKARDPTIELNKARERADQPCGQRERESVLESSQGTLQARCLPLVLATGESAKPCERGVSSPEPPYPKREREREYESWPQRDASRNF